MTFCRLQKRFNEILSKYAEGGDGEQGISEQKLSSHQGTMGVPYGRWFWVSPMDVGSGGLTSVMVWAYIIQKKFRRLTPSIVHWVPVQYRICHTLCDLFPY